MNHSRAFTLIELLVVISIISIVIAILLPALGYTREMATRSICGQQLRQILIAQTSYAVDHQGRLLSPILPPTPGATPSTYELLSFFMHGPARESFYGYLGDYSALVCPSFQKTSTLTATPEQFAGDEAFVRSATYGYRYDTWLTGYQWNTVAYVADADRPDSLDDVRSDKTVVADVIVNLSSLAGATSWLSQNYRGHVDQSLIPRGSNVGRLDGSVVWKTMPEWYAVDPLPVTTMGDWGSVDGRYELKPHLHTGDGTTTGRSSRPARPWFH